ncbi:MAG: hypothetical protein IJL48_09435 [Bacteroidales bacterium]|nr:hypothetical protein [Bacteroidales bacterium]
MASVNFFDPQYQSEQAKSDIEFGLYDPGDNSPTITTNNYILSQAVVSNPNGRPVNFIPIDHNIILTDNNGNQLSLCDGLLHVEKTFLAFIELKDVMHNWIDEAVSQLENTIEIFKQNHYYLDYKNRRAYAANKEHPYFCVSRKELMQQFHQKSGFRLIIQNNIIIP